MLFMGWLVAAAYDWFAGASVSAMTCVTRVLSLFVVCWWQQGWFNDGFIYKIINIPTTYVPLFWPCQALLSYCKNKK